MDITNRLCNSVQAALLRALADWKVTGADNVPPDGPLLVVANHQSYFDPSLLSTSIPRRVRFLAKNTIFKGPVASWFLYNYGAYPLDRGGSDLGAYRWALGQLGQGGALGVFPEGTRSPGGMREARNGVARLALASKAALLPVGITGTENLESLLRVFNPTGTIRVRIGEPFSLPQTTARKPSKGEMDSLSDTIMRRIADLLPESYHGVYGPVGRQPAGTVQ